MSARGAGERHLHAARPSTPAAPPLALRGPPASRRAASCAARREPACYDRPGRLDCGHTVVLESTNNKL
ncbi:unnamed protein product [Arctia plantaginis]|uniref:Uncharacterized protein n=1 Tax=Arctia plantaginis TaxID=874455 RepID=A0A8S1AX68_ARCPL|nr:unnamed protein product [Arctia plantaginis]